MSLIWEKMHLSPRYNRRGGRPPPPPRPTRPFQSSYIRPDNGDAPQSRSEPYTHPRDRLTATAGPSRTGRGDGGIPRFESEEDKEQRMRKVYQRSEPTGRYKMPQEVSASMRQELFDKTASYASARPVPRPSFINPRHRPELTAEPPKTVQSFDFAEEVAPSWQSPESESAPETPGRDPLLNLGIRPIIVSRLKSQFPEVVEPTAFQTALIHGILSGRDVVAKEDTGEGKTFALLLSLLSIERPDRKRSTVLFIVPSSTLAHQIYEWAVRLIPLKSSIPSTVGLLLRPSLPSSPSLEQRRDALLATPPHILIVTPTALAALSEYDIHALAQYVKVIAIDEADSLLFVPSGKESSRKLAALKEKPTRTVLLMRSLFTRKASMKPAGSASFVRKPQVILLSATLSKSFRHHVTEREKWVHRGLGTVHIPHDSHVGGMMPKVLLGLSDGRGGEGRFKGQVQHHVVVVSPKGDLRNLESEPILPLEPALRPAVTAEGKPDTDVQPHVAEAIAELWALGEEKAQLEEEKEGGGGWTTTGSNPSRRRATLVVVPEGVRATQLAKDLREFGMDARGIEMDNDQDRLEVMTRTGGPSSSSTKPKPKPQPDDDLPPPPPPTSPSSFTSPIYIYSPSQLRGIDIPSLTQILLLSKAFSTAPDYIHLSGRVGRMGRSGRVITLVEGDQQETEQDRALRAASLLARETLDAKQRTRETFRRQEKGGAVEGEVLVQREELGSGRVPMVRIEKGETERVARMLNERVGGVEVEKLEYVR
ncbi:P-loop containing nucleoside triphosphate hydrolase protein [Mrakia frigida]|uniref:P-loop containing nucleoside triphosphate hydrolase protein n=1 Tax=Mrakia frigida TaxID=29902 RepID=UPI003FCC1AE6